MKKKFSKSWISSTQPRKQRKYRAQAPLHIKNKFMSSHLSKELKVKYNTRSVRLRVDDKIKILRGQFKGQLVKVERVNIKKNKIYLTGIELVKKDGTKVLYPINPSNVVIMELYLDDKKRIKSLEKTQKK